MPLWGWQEQSEHVTGGGGENVRQDKNASSWLPIVKAPNSNVWAKGVVFVLSPNEDRQ